MAKITFEVDSANFNELPEENKEQVLKQLRTNVHDLINQEVRLVVMEQNYRKNREDIQSFYEQCMKEVGISLLPITPLCQGCPVGIEPPEYIETFIIPLLLSEKLSAESRNKLLKAIANDTSGDYALLINIMANNRELLTLLEKTRT
jgi:hypothetical protein